MAAAAVAPTPTPVPPFAPRKKPRYEGKARANDTMSKFCAMDENVDRAALVPVTKGEFRIDTSASYDGTPQGNAWDPFKNGRGVEIKVWVPEDRATGDGDFLAAMRSLGPGLLTTLKGYATTFPTAKRRNAFLKKLDKDGFMVINPGKIKFDSSGACEGFVDPAYVRLGFQWWMERDGAHRLDSTFRIEDSIGGNLTQTLAVGTDVDVYTDPVWYRTVADDGTTSRLDIDGFAPFVRFNDASQSWIHGCITGQQTYDGATVRLSLKDLNLYFTSALVTDHLGYITVRLIMRPAYVPDAYPEKVISQAITAVLRGEDDKPVKSGFV